LCGRRLCACATPPRHCLTQIAIKARLRDNNHQALHSHRGRWLPESQIG
jgi:hypothetical protein